MNEPCGFPNIVIGGGMAMLLTLSRIDNGSNRLFILGLGMFYSEPPLLRINSSSKLESSNSFVKNFMLNDEGGGIISLDSWNIFLSRCLLSKSILENLSEYSNSVPFCCAFGNAYFRFQSILL